jgi:hypothetical protein
MEETLQESLTDVLSVVCPRCRAARGGRCLEPVIWGSQYIVTPHEERVAAATAEAGELNG